MYLHVAQRDDRSELFVVQTDELATCDNSDDVLLSSGNDRR